MEARYDEDTDLVEIELSRGQANYIAAALMHTTGSSLTADVLLGSMSAALAYIPARIEQLFEYSGKQQRVSTPKMLIDAGLMIRSDYHDDEVVELAMSPAAAAIMMALVGNSDTIGPCPCLSLYSMFKNLDAVKCLYDRAHWQNIVDLGRYSVTKKKDGDK